MDPSTNIIVDAFERNLAIGIIVVLLLAVAFLFKSYVASNNAHLATVKEVLPVTQKLIEAVAILQRLADRKED